MEECLEAVLPQSEIEYKEANTEHAKQMKTSARTTKRFDTKQFCPVLFRVLIAQK